MANSLSHVLPYPIRQCLFTLEISFRTSAGTPTDPTSADTELSSDGGATSSDCTNEITTGSGNGVGYLTLTSTELNNNVVWVIAKSANCLTSLVALYPRILASVGTGTLSAGSAGGGTLGTLLAYDVTGCFIQTTGGTGGASGAFQARKIVTYNTTTGAFTVTPNWETTPSTDTTYSVLLPEGVTLGMLKALNPTTAGRTAVVDASGLIDANMVKAGPTGSGVAWNANTTTHLNVIYDTDYTDNYDASAKALLVKLANKAMGGSSLNITYASAQDFTSTQKSSVTAAVPSAATIAATVEAAILNEGDATALLAAISAKVEEFLINEGDATATLAAIAAACNAAVVAGTVGTNVAAVKAKTDNLPASPAAVGSAMTLTLSQAIPMVDVSGDSTVTVGSSLLSARAQGAGAWAIVGTVLTLKNPDGTTFRSFNLDSLTAPLSRT